MNIVVMSLDNIKLTNFDPNAFYDLDEIRLFISNDFSTEKPSVSLVNSHEFIVEEDLSIAKNSFKGYRLWAKQTIPEGAYSFIINTEEGQSETDLINLKEKQLLEDEHEVILIKDRKISPVTTTIVAGDLNSQQLTFYIKRKYDGISFLDESKKIYFDYIPINKEDRTLIDETTGEKIELPFVSSDDVIVAFMEEPPIGQEGEWMAVKWNLPASATNTRGSVKFAMSVIEDGKKYVWQTLPSSFVVSEGIGPRFVSTPINGTFITTEELFNSINNVENRVDEVEELLGYQADDNIDNDVEVIIGGGGAPDLEEGE